MFENGIDKVRYRDIIYGTYDMSHINTILNAKHGYTPCYSVVAWGQMWICTCLITHLMTVNAMPTKKNTGL